MSTEAMLRELENILKLPREAENADEAQLSVTAQRLRDEYQDRCLDFITIHGPALAEVVRDAERFRWLLEDHADAKVRETIGDILKRMRVMSYFSAISAIDAARGIG